MFTAHKGVREKTFNIRRQTNTERRFAKSMRIRSLVTPDVNVGVNIISNYRKTSVNGV